MTVAMQEQTAWSAAGQVIVDLVTIDAGNPITLAGLL